MDEKFMLRLGAVVRQARKEQGLTQTDLGAKVQRPQASIARLESGQHGDTYLGFVLDIAKALDMPVEEMMARVVGRELRPAVDGERQVSEVLEEIKNRLSTAEPHAVHLVEDIFSQLASWVGEVSAKKP